MRICFYLEYRDLKGGYTNLIIALIKELHLQKIETVLFNFKDGLIASELSKVGIEINIVDLDTIDWKKIDQVIFKNDILILSRFLEVYYNFLEINPRILYYDINDDICNISKYKFGLGFQNLGKKLIKELISHKSLVFMDNTGVDNLKNVFNMELHNEVYIPLPVDIPLKNMFINQDLKTKPSLNLTYIGRSVDWKMMPLKKIIEDCASLNLNKKIIITAVVDSIPKLKRFINVNLYKDNENLEIILLENLLPSQLDGFLLKNSDLHFAMGTAALDAAKLGIPTILIDASPNPFPEDYTYSWIFQSKKYSLGRFIHKVNFEKGITMEVLLSRILNNSDAMEFSVKCYNYVVENHSIKNITPKLLDVINGSEFRLKDAKPYYLYYSKMHRIIKKLFVRKKVQNS